MFETLRAMYRLRKRMGLPAWLMVRPSELNGMIESEKFAMQCERADKRKLWALVTGWDKLLDKPAVWKGGELI
jgi:hypothetical protein